MVLVPEPNFEPTGAFTPTKKRSEREKSVRKWNQKIVGFSLRTVTSSVGVSNRRLGSEKTSRKETKAATENMETNNLQWRYLPVL